MSASANGGGLASNGGSINVQNTIVAMNSADTTGQDIFGTFTSQGHNLISDGTGGSGFLNGTNGDQVGTTAAPIDARLDLRPIMAGQPTRLRCYRVVRRSMPAMTLALPRRTSAESHVHRETMSISCV